MEFIDTHAHLYDEAFAGEEDAAVERAIQAGVTRIIFPDIDSQTREHMFRIADRHEGTVFPCLGLHPTSIDASWEKEMEKVHDNLSHKIWAIGEIGIDCYWSKEFLEQQKEAFRVQMELAYKKDLPVIIHVREATDEVFQVLDSLGGSMPRGVFHAFSGSWETYDRISRYGDFMVGIGGVVTYKNAGVAKSIERIPLERIVLETDCPYLTPVPMRGKRNDSSYLAYIAEKIAQVKGCTLEEVAAATTANAKEMFRL